MSDTDTTRWVSGADMTASFGRVWEALDRQTHINELLIERLEALEEDAASLRDFVHDLNDRHTSVRLDLDDAWLAIKQLYSSEGATAPVAEVGDRD